MKIKSTIAYILISAILASFSYAVAFGTPEKNSAPVVVNSSYTQIVVTKARPTAQIAPQNIALQSPGISKCSSAKIGSEAVLLQNGGIINLNQPAECFSLSVQKEYSNAEIEVKSLSYNNFEVKVVSPKIYIQTQELSQGTSKTAAFTFAVGFVVFLILDNIVFRRNKNISLVKQTTRLNHHFDIFELNVLRC
jgi:hypothetical protein